MTRNKRFISLFVLILVMLLGFSTTVFAEKNKESKIEISSDFWINKEGYRKGESIVVSSYLSEGPMAIKAEDNLNLTSFDLILDYESEETVTLPLYDDGNEVHRDIKASDGLYTNKLVFENLGTGNASIVASGKYNNEKFNVEESIGEFSVKEPGNIILTYNLNDLSKTHKNSFDIPIKIKNESEFKEKIYVTIDESLGELEERKLILDPISSLATSLNFTLDKKLDKGLYDLNLKIMTENEFTNVNENELLFKIEKIGFFERIFIKATKNPLYIYGVLIFALSLLSLYFIVILFYLLLVKRKLKLKGSLSYKLKTNPKDVKTLDLRSKKKRRIEITFDKNKEADFHIKSKLYDYSIILKSSLDSDESPFIMGMKAIFLRKNDVNYEAMAEIPGILFENGRETRNINLYGDDTFSSEEYIFNLSLKKSIWIKKEKEGKDLLEDKIG